MVISDYSLYDCQRKNSKWEKQMNEHNNLVVAG